MLNAAHNAGIDRIACTPHCKNSFFDHRRIVKNFEALQEYAWYKKIELDLGFEVYWEKLVEIGFENASDLCIGGTNLLLLEFALGSMPAQWQQLIAKFRAQGIQPIIAHPERYQAVQSNLEIAAEMKNLGCLLQLSGNFASGGRLSISRKTALALLKHDLVDYIASDAHCAADYTIYTKALKLAQKIGY